VFPVPDPGKLVPEKVHDFLVKVFFSVAIAQWGAYTLLVWDAAGAGRGCWNADSVLYCNGGLVLDVFEEIDQR
jgi:hypothetical protein